MTNKTLAQIWGTKKEDAAKEAQAHQIEGLKRNAEVTVLNAQDRVASAERMLATALKAAENAPTADFSQIARAAQAVAGAKDGVKVLEDLKKTLFG